MKSVQLRGRELRAIATAAVGLLLFTPVACSDWLNVQTPDIINPPDVANAAGAVGQYNGAIGAFTFAKDGDNGGTEGQILVSGVLSDEYFDAETFPTRIEYDSRNITEQNTTLTTVFFNLAQARVGAEHAAAALKQYAPSPKSRVGEMFNLAGMTYVMFAENYCSAVPFDERNPDGTVANGQPLTTTQMLNLAVARFDSSLVYDSGATAGPLTQKYTAQVGLGRALLDLGTPAQAAAAVAGVPTSFVYNSVHSTATGREFNGVNWFNGQAPNGTGRFSVADQEGGVGLNFRSALDPRVQDTLNGFGFDGKSPLFVLKKYPSSTSPVPVANGVEARLIEAEAALGTPATLMADLNALRTDGNFDTVRVKKDTVKADTTTVLDTVYHAGTGGVAGLAPLTDPGTNASRVNLLFRERAFWLFATGHRLGDLRRLVRQYGVAVDSVYPNGAYFKGAPTFFGTSTELPVPFQERNNPNYKGCDYTTP